MPELDTTREAVAFAQILVATPPDRVTACNGWTAHELLAHMVAGGIEIATIVGAFLRTRRSHRLDRLTSAKPISEP